MLGRWWPRRERARSGAVVAMRLTDGDGGQPTRIDFVRVERGADGRALVTCQGQGPASQLGAWHAGGAFRDAQLVLMLRASQRQILVLDRPEVPDAEQADALRWPVAEALDAPAESVLFDATPLPLLKDGGKPQVLVAAASLRTVQPLLDTLAQAGLRPDALDVVDMAQRNAALLQQSGAAKGAQIVLGLSGAEVLVGLVAGGELCMARNMPLPTAHSASGDEAVRERIVLHVQRTVDLLERQITRFAINGAYAIAGDFDQATLDALRQGLPVSLKEIGLADVVALDGAATARVAPVDGASVRLAALAALRCVAPARQAVAPEPVTA